MADYRDLLPAIVEREGAALPDGLRGITLWPASPEEMA